MHIKTDKKTGKAAADAEKEKAKTAGETVKEFAGHVERAQTEEEKTDTKLDVTTIVENSPEPKAVAAEAEKGYDLMIIGLEKTVARRNEFHDDVAGLAAGFEGPIAITDVRDKLLEHPLHGKLTMLVPVNGTEMSRRAAEIAIAMARASKASLTALYVAARRQEEALAPIRGGHPQGHRRARRQLRTGAAHRGARRRRRRRSDPEGMARGKHNLIVMGVGRRPGEKLFFGDTAAALLEKSERSLLFVAS